MGDRKSEIQSSKAPVLQASLGNRLSVPLADWQLNDTHYLRFYARLKLHHVRHWIPTRPASIDSRSHPWLPLSVLCLSTRPPPLSESVADPPRRCPHDVYSRLSFPATIINDKVNIAAVSLWTRRKWDDISCGGCDAKQNWTHIGFTLRLDWSDNRYLFFNIVFRWRVGLVKQTVVTVFQLCQTVNVFRCRF